MSLAVALACLGTWATGCVEDEPYRAVPCVEERTELTDVLTPTELGFSVTEITQFALGTHTNTLEWLASEGDQQITFTRVPAAGPSQITLTIAPRAENAELVISTLEGGIAPEVDDERCPDRVEVPVSVQVHTAEGALVESFDANLEAVTGHMARIRHQLRADRLAGNLTVSDLQVADLAVPGEPGPLSVNLELTVSPLGLNGVIGSRFDMLDSGGFVLGSGELVHAATPSWPERRSARECVRWGALVQGDGASLAGLEPAVIESLIAATSDWTWSTSGAAAGTGQPLTLSMSHEDGQVCYRELVDSEGLTPIVLEVDLVATLSATDGSFNVTQLPVRAQLQADAYAQPKQVVLQSRANETILDAVTFDQRAQFSRVNPHEFHALGIQLLATLDVQANANAAIDGQPFLMSGVGEMVVYSWTTATQDVGRAVVGFDLSAGGTP